MKLRELEARTGQALHGCRGESTVVLILPLLGWGILLLFELLGRYFCLVQGMPGLVPWITGLRCLVGALGSVPFCSGAAWWFMQDCRIIWEPQQAEIRALNLRSESM